jgi:hypothetical protein
MVGLGVGLGDVLIGFFMQRMNPRVRVMSTEGIGIPSKLDMKESIRSPSPTSSWYRAGIQLRDEEKKNGSTLNLEE